jgi:hypothetical protein
MIVKAHPAVAFMAINISKNPVQHSRTKHIILGIISLEILLNILLLL